MQCRCRPTPSQRTWVIKSCSQYPSASLGTLSTRLDISGREARGIAGLVAASQPRNVLLATDNDRDDPNRLGPNGPKLLPRPIRPKSDGGPDSRNGGGRGGGGSGGGGKEPAGVEERFRASLAAYTGLVGTTALVLSKLAGVDLWAEFDWASLGDLKLAVEVSVPLQLLNAALLLPSYSSPKQPPDFGNLQTLEANLKSEQERQEQKKTTSPPASSSPVAGVEDAAIAPVAAVTTPTAEPPSVAAATTSTESPLSASSSPPSNSAAAPQMLPPPAEATTSTAMVPAGLWGRSSEAGSSKDKRAGEDSWASLRSALHLAQGNYISNNPTGRLSPAAEAAFVFLDTAASEMLYRGVALAWLAGWLQDRVYEAGMDEILTYDLPAAATTLGLPSARDGLATLGVYGACECAVAVGVAAFMVWLATARSRRAIQRLEMVMKSSISPTSAASSSTAPKPGDSAAGAGAGVKAPGGAGSDSSAARAAAQVLLGPGGLSVGPSGAVAVMQRAAAIQAARDTIQVLLLNGIFIASGGNLAASYTASVINQLLFSVMQRRGVKRIRERSAALRRQLIAYNVQMHRIATKYKDKLPQEAASRLDRLAEEDAVAGASASSSSTAAATIIKDDSSTGSSKTSSSSGTISSNSGLEVHGSSSAPSTAISSSQSTAFADSIDSDSAGDSCSSSVASSNSSRDSSGGSSVVASSDSLVTSTARPVMPAAAAGTTDDGLGTSSSSEPIDNSSNGSSSLIRVLTMLDRLVPEPSKPAAAVDKKPRPLQQQQQKQAASQPQQERQ